MPRTAGIHHVTAIASDPQRNLDFYVGTLGLRLVKRTVNFDDPATYHFYFGDETGSPGSLLTFFPWPGARRGRAGAGQVAVTSFAAPAAAIGFWVERLVARGVAFDGPTTRRFAGGVAESVLAFRDPDGMLLEIVGLADAGARGGWGGPVGVPAAHALRGIAGVTLWVAEHEGTGAVLTGPLGLVAAGEEEATRRYRAAGDAAGGRVDVRAVSGFPRGVEGAGTVHHVAWRAADERAQLALREAVIAAGGRPTPVIDRLYFRSVYFREPGGVLFELATDGPGFAVDEPRERFGLRLALPPRLEVERAEIEALLPEIRLPADEPMAAPGSPATPAAAPAPAAPGGPPAAIAMDDPEALGFLHRFEPPSGSGREREVTLLLLHGTGGNEDDLLPLGRALLPGAALLAPRGQVLEDGRPRFFRRFAEGVLDLEDLARRTPQLAAFVAAAADAYRRDPDGVVAVGFSNGANMAASLLLRGSRAVAAAVLLSPMLPFEPDAPPALAGVGVFIGAGRADPLVPAPQVERLAEVLRAGGAVVTVRWDPGGHTIAPGTVEAARAWLAEWLSRRPSPDRGPDAGGD